MNYDDVMQYRDYHQCSLQEAKAAIFKRDKLSTLNQLSRDAIRSDDLEGLKTTLNALIQMRIAEVEQS